MKASRVRAVVAVLALLVAMPALLFGQASAPTQVVAPSSQAQLDQLLAPIALS